MQSFYIVSWARSCASSLLPPLSSPALMVGGLLVLGLRVVRLSRIFESRSARFALWAWTGHVELKVLSLTITVGSARFVVSGESSLGYSIYLRMRAVA